MHPLLTDTDHRPWPMLSSPWAWNQTWHDLCFVHWQIDPDVLLPHLPADLELDLYDGKAWVGIVPFYMSGVTRRPIPPISLLSDFPEINVRTYVRHENKNGVWFFSLHVSNRLAVWMARMLFHLPYRHARIQLERGDTAIDYRMAGRDAHFRARYTAGQPREFQPDSFEIWATERYCLYSQDRYGRLYRCEIHHRQWPLQAASIEIETNDLTDFLELGKQHPSVLYCPQLEVVIWPIERLDAETPA